MLKDQDAAGLSPSSIRRLTESWQAEHRAFGKRELRFCRYAYWFVDGVHVSIRLGEDPNLRLLVVIGVREDGTKEVLAVEDGYRRSTDSWSGVMHDLKARSAKRADPGCRRRCARDLGGARGRVPGRSLAGVLGTCDLQRARLPVQAPAAPRQGTAAQDDGGPDPG